jgi:tetratricopeptide (TPR) repeat protein
MKHPNETGQPGPLGSPKEVSQDSDRIRVFDEYGRELSITRQEWRDKLLADALKRVWDKPDGLAALIIQSLEDKFFEEMVRPALRLRDIDPNRERAAIVLSIVYLKLGRTREAEKALMKHLRANGETGVVLTNLAKVYAAKHEEDRCLDTLWRGLQLDPNQDNGLMWYAAIQREKGGEKAQFAALQRVAALSGSWRAQLWLARASLKNGSLEEAVKFYRESLSRVPRPAPTDMLMQMSGDLGNSAHLPELVNLVEPQFHPAFHGLLVGNNLIKAHLDLGQIDQARKIIDQLYALTRPDWKKTLDLWDAEAAKLDVRTAARPSPTPPKLTLLTFNGPIWLPKESMIGALSPIKSAAGPRISFLVSSAKIKQMPPTIERQLSDKIGRLTRAMPLFLAEQIYFCTEAQASVLVPWILSGGFVLSGTPWSSEEVAHQSRQVQPPADYLVASNIDAQTSTWVADLSLVRTIDAKCLGSLSGTFPSSQPEKEIPELAEKLIALLVEHAEVRCLPCSTLYSVPQHQGFSNYLLRLEQLLALRSARLIERREDFLYGEREIIQGNIELCVEYRTNVVTRLLLAQTMLAMKEVRPNILREFKDKITALQRANPLDEPERSVLEGMFQQALAEQ